MQQELDTKVRALLTEAENFLAICKEKSNSMDVRFQGGLSLLIEKKITLDKEHPDFLEKTLDESLMHLYYSIVLTLAACSLLQNQTSQCIDLLKPHLADCPDKLHDQFHRIVAYAYSNQLFIKPHVDLIYACISSLKAIKKQNTRDKLVLANALHSQAKYYKEECSQCILYLNEALDIYYEIQHEDYIAVCQFALALCHRKLGNHAIAAEFYSLIQISLNTNNRSQLINAASILAFWLNCNPAQLLESRNNTLVLNLNVIEEMYLKVQTQKPGETRWFNQTGLSLTITQASQHLHEQQEALTLDSLVQVFEKLPHHSHPNFTAQITAYHLDTCWNLIEQLDGENIEQNGDAYWCLKADLYFWLTKCYEAKSDLKEMLRVALICYETIKCLNQITPNYARLKFLSAGFVLLGSLEDDAPKDDSWLAGFKYYLDWLTAFQELDGKNDFLWQLFKDNFNNSCQKFAADSLIACFSQSINGLWVNVSTDYFADSLRIFHKMLKEEYEVEDIGTQQMDYIIKIYSTFTYIVKQEPKLEHYCRILDKYEPLIKNITDPVHNTQSLDLGMHRSKSGSESHDPRTPQSSFFGRRSSYPGSDLDPPKPKKYRFK